MPAFLRSSPYEISESHNLSFERQLCGCGEPAIPAAAKRRNLGMERILIHTLGEIVGDYIGRAARRFDRGWADDTVFRYFQDGLQHFCGAGRTLVDGSIKDQEIEPVR